MKLNKTDKEALKTALKFGCKYIYYEYGNIEFQPKPNITKETERSNSMERIYRRTYRLSTTIHKRTEKRKLV